MDWNCILKEHVALQHLLKGKHRHRSQKDFLVVRYFESGKLNHAGCTQPHQDKCWKKDKYDLANQCCPPNELNIILRDCALEEEQCDATPHSLVEKEDKSECDDGKRDGGQTLKEGNLRRWRWSRLFRNWNLCHCYSM
ncbi:MAG: hypothetical protein HW407_2091, partial [Bacteroidetes bacterium]|nr:hypothetical protein [Bacteroidota bacterium]